MKNKKKGETIWENLTDRTKRRLRDRRKNMDEWNSRDHRPFCPEPFTYAHNEFLHKICNRERIRLCLPYTLGSVAVSTTITTTTNTTITAISGATAIKATVRAGEENWERADVRRFRFYPRKSLKFLPYPPPPTTLKKSILPFTLLFAKGTNGGSFKNTYKYYSRPCFPGHKKLFSYESIIARINVYVGRLRT